MTATMDAALGASEYASYFQFLLLLMIGTAAGCLLAAPRRLCAWTTSLAMMGVCGAWLGAEFAHLFGQAENGGVQQMIAAAAGACALSYSWRRIHQPPADQDDAGVAIHQPHA